MPAWLLATQLMGAFRQLVEEAHSRLATRGFPGARPVHGFALQAVGAGATASAIASRLGVTKQAAAKTVAALERQGYVERRGDVADARRKLIRRTARGDAFIEASARAFEDVVTAWRAQVGSDAVDALQDALNRLDLPSPTPLDLGSWSSQTSP